MLSTGASRLRLKKNANISGSRASMMSSSRLWTCASLSVSCASMRAKRVVNPSPSAPEAIRPSARCLRAIVSMRRSQAASTGAKSASPSASSTIRNPWPAYRSNSSRLRERGIRPWYRQAAATATVNGLVRDGRQALQRAHMDERRGFRGRHVADDGVRPARVGPYVGTPVTRRCSSSAKRRGNGASRRCRRRVATRRPSHRVRDRHAAPRTGGR